MQVYSFSLFFWKVTYSCLWLEDLKIISYILCNTLVYIKIMYKIFFIFYLNTKSKILLVRRTKYITSIGLFYKNAGILLGVVSDCEELVGVNHRRWWDWPCVEYCGLIMSYCFTSLELYFTRKRSLLPELVLMSSHPEVYPVDSGIQCVFPIIHVQRRNFDCNHHDYTI